MEDPPMVKTELYTKPEVEVVAISSSDIITSSKDNNVDIGDLFGNS